MDELIGWMIVIVGAIVAVFFAVWILVATVVRIFAWVLVFWIVELVLGLVAGILVGVFLPPRVLRGKTTATLKVSKPADVVAGKVLGKAPRGPSKHFGWDRAWPVYNPHQAKHDARAVIGENGKVVGRAYKLLLDDEAWHIRGPLLGPAFAGFAAGAWLSIAVWSLMMVLVGGLVYLGQQAGILGYRWHDRLTRRRRKATLHCARCYRITAVPTYHCPNPACTILHHDITPGPLGIVRRRCDCGTSLPTTVGIAGRHLVTVCPYCLHNVPKGSGTRRVLPIPVIGAVGAGKTQFLSSGVVGLEQQVKRLSGSLTAISPVASEFMTSAKATVTAGRRVDKTEWKDVPEGVPLILNIAGKELELQLMDASGEKFVDWERSQSLSYIDTADLLFFLLDPLALPEIGELLKVMNKTGLAPVAEGDPEDSYASVIDRLRAEDVRLGTKSLAIIVSKVDVLQKLDAAEKLSPVDGDSIRRWLTDHGADGFVRRVDQDFRNVSYFSVDSYGERNALDILHPIHVFDWALRTTHPRWAVMPPPASPTDKEQVP